MGAGFLVGALDGVEAGGHEVEWVGEAVLLLLEQVQGEGTGVVGLEAERSEPGFSLEAGQAPGPLPWLTTSPQR